MTSVKLNQTKDEPKKSWKSLCQLSVIMFLLSLLLLALIALLMIESQKCTLSLDDADRCAQKVSFFGDPDVFIPLNNADMNKHCKIMTENIECVRKFGSNCLPSFPQQIFSIITYDMVKVIRRRCRDPHQRQKFLRHAKCWSTPAGKLEPVSECFERHIGQLEHLSESLEPDWQIPAICCTYHQRHDCVRREIRRACGYSDAKYVTEIIDDTVKDVMTFACGPYQSMIACDKRLNSTVWLPLKMMAIAGPSANQSLPKLRVRHRSGLPPLVKIITHFDM